MTLEILDELLDAVATPAPATAGAGGNGPGLGLPAIEEAAEEPDDRQLWSVTTMIGVLDKKGIPYWTAEGAAVAAIHQQATWRGMLADCEKNNPECDHRSAKRCPVVKWLRDAAYRKTPGQRSATERGTLVHAAAEEYALTGKRPEVEPDIRPYLDRFDEWLQHFTPSYQATEVAVYHPDLGYAGTADAFLTIGGHGAPTLPGTDAVRFIGDYKTAAEATDSKGQPTKPYPSEVGPQLAAYRWAKFAAIWRPRRNEKFRRRYYLLGPHEQAMAVPVPEVDTGLCIHITPESCEAYPIQCGSEVFEAYLAIQDAAKWVFQDSRRVMGDPLVPATKEA